MAKDRKELWRAIKFTLISISAGIIEAVSFALLEVFVFVGQDVAIPQTISLVLSVLWNFTINRKATFKASDNIVKSMSLVALFYFIFTPTSALFVSWVTGIGLDPFIAKAISMVANFVLEFLYLRFVVYRNTCDTAETK